MSPAPPPRERVRLVDVAEEPGRTTATLLASLAARLGALYLVSGADAIGSIAAGLAALGREVSRTADGASLRRALLSGRAGANGQRLWNELRIAEWVSAMPPAPVIDQLRNDLGLLLASDLEATLELMPIPSQMTGAGEASAPAPAQFVDYVIGLWYFSRELVNVVEMLAAPTLPAPGGVDPSPASGEPAGNLLR